MVPATYGGVQRRSKYGHLAILGCRSTHYDCGKGGYHTDPVQDFSNNHYKGIIESLQADCFRTGSNAFNAISIPQYTFNAKSP